MTIEKAFAIKAVPAAIWEALWADLSEGEEGRFAVEHSNWPNRFTLRLELAGLPCRLSYRIGQRDDDCEVAVTLEPLSRRYLLYQMLTFGHMRRNYEMMLVQGLINLKQALEVDESIDGHEAEVSSAAEDLE
jgi:hypothetical protein